MLKQCDNVKVVTCRDKTQHVYNFQLNFAAPITFTGIYSGATTLLFRHSHSMPNRTVVSIQSLDICLPPKKVCVTLTSVMLIFVYFPLTEDGSVYPGLSEIGKKTVKLPVRS